MASVPGPSTSFKEDEDDKAQEVEDIWWKNYCVDEQTSTHPIQITV